MPLPEPLRPRPYLRALRLPATPVLALALLAAAPCVASAQSTPQPPRQEVQQAVDALRQENALPPPVKRHTLRFKERAYEPPKPEPRKEREPARQADTGSTSFDVLARYGVWLLGFALLALLLVQLRRWVRERADTVFAAAAPDLPSHVHSLDVRPESLPATVGAAAAALWRGGEPRAALALLYRGALSRLIHGHGVPVRSASTEGECLALAADRLDAPRQELFARLVGAWQQAVYAARLPATEGVLALCQDFDRLLCSPATPGGEGTAP